MPRKIRGIGYVVVFVERWPEAMHFYGNVLGIEVVRRQDEQGFAEFAFPDGGPNLMVERADVNDDGAGRLVGRFVGLSVAVHDAVEVYHELAAAGVRFEKPPERQEWGGMLAHFFDPDGNRWSLVEVADC